MQVVYLDVFRQIDRFEDSGPGSYLNRHYAILDNKLAAAHRQVREVDRELAAAGRLGKSEAALVALTRRALSALRQSMDRMGDFTRVS